MSQKSFSGTAQIDLSYLIFFLLKKWKVFIFSSILCFVIFSIISLNLTKIWTSDALLVESGGAGNSQSQGTASIVANLTGVNLGGSGSDVLITLKRRVGTKDFFKILIEDELVYKNLFAVSGYDEKTKTNIYNLDIYDPEKSQWLVRPTFFDSYRKYRSIVKSGFMDETVRDFLVIKAEHVSPISAKFIVDAVILRINELKRSEDIKEAESMLAYLETELAQTNQMSIKSAINSLIENQIKTKTFANAKSDYLVKKIDSAYVPERRTKPRRAYFVIISTIIFEFILVFFFILLAIYKSMQNENKA